ncbi:MAG: hydrogenase formation protein HypD [Deltaproteobacteria bacterium]|uniref:Hydrogenase formation protein HypD n=1 Tax=Candidatus Zymogenus saltonus TaxID=2844893 RepID=A0A9D8KGK8_9DELT|nr:hydrogenase formation protein HypD [Candidatus Zymogenus saltonus]
MKFIDEYRDPKIAKGLVSAIKRRSERLKSNISIMEVCGTHTHSINRFGIKSLLPENVRLVSGPGCPVCVTSIQDIDRALFLAKEKGVIFTTFGDMMRVPGTDGASLEMMRSDGANIAVVSSPLNAVSLAEEKAEAEVVLLGIGFETTSPTVAAAVMSAKKRGLTNFSVFSVHKVIPPAIKILLDDPKINVDGFLCPGHVSIILGAGAYSIIPEKGRAAVITGFEPLDILEGILMTIDQIVEERFDVEIQYKRAVKEEGNPNARTVMDGVFDRANATWRGLGEIPESGLVFNSEHRSFDALERFNVPEIESKEDERCSCGEILKGVMSPDECPLFGSVCNPRNPVGPCMVSSEGACSAFYKYR